MKDQTHSSNSFIASAYETYRQPVFFYILNKINDREEAEDLAQDTFLHLLDYRQMLREDTIKCFIFTIARNLVNDYLRRYYKRQEVSSYLFETVSLSSSETESRILADDLAKTERMRIAALPAQRRTVYMLSRFEGKTSTEIADALNLSRRTVENHLLLGRKDVRGFMKACI